MFNETESTLFSDTESASLPFLVDVDRRPFADVRVKARPEDFIVEEIPSYEPCGEGTHTFFLIEKTRLNTDDAVRRLAHAVGKRPKDGGVAGQKDAKAIARQWISFEHVDANRLGDLELGNDLRLIRTSRHVNKLKKGHLRGNRFRIRLRHENPEPLADHARAVLAALAKRGVPNYYGVQRFGRAGGNVELGMYLARGDEQGFAVAAKASGISPDRVRDRKMRRFLVNALQSSLFNRVLSRRMPKIDELWKGDLAFLHRNGAVFLVEDVAAEAPRCARFEISPSGPLFGPKMMWPEGAAAELERSVLKACETDAADFGRPEAQRQPGERRALRVPLLEDFVVSGDAEGVILEFALPSGAYATIVLRELLGDESMG